MIKEFDSLTLGKMIMESISGTVSHYLIYDSTNGKIMGLSHTLLKAFGLK